MPKFDLDKGRLRRLRKILKKVNQEANGMARLTDGQLRHKTDEFKARYQEGESLDELLPEAFAAVREAAKRVLGMYPYDVQVLGGIVLHEGHIAEMKTGEGKTLTATLPIYLNALTGRGVILVTVNDYLSCRDAEEMGPLYRFMGLSIAMGAPEDADDLEAEDKKAIYAADIVYTTHSSLGFDYLIENLADSRDQQYLRDFYYVIIDEVDAVLLDSATSPLVIAGSPRVQSNLYALADDFVVSLEEEQDYYVTDEKDGVWLTQKGIKLAEEYFRLEKFYHKDNRELVRQVSLALRAHCLFENEKDYVVQDDELVLLDSTDGRLLKGTRLQAGQHQALEAKEHVSLTADNRSMASITYQNLFKLFDKMAGMTGTGKPAEDEFIETYQMEVIAIPTHKPVIRKDLPDSIYRSFPDKVYAAIQYIKERHATGQPLLIATGSVQLSALYSAILLKEGIPHNVLNAYNAVKEAEMVKEAGQMGAVTVATAMAGRGTDIKLGSGVAELGGLAVIGTEHMTSERIDLQLRGRAGRQGDPGMSKFFVSLEDELIHKWGPEHIRYYSDEDTRPPQAKALSNFRYQKYFEQAQEASDSSSESSRQQILQMDEDMRIQRELIYRDRNALLAGGGLKAIDFESLAQEVFEAFTRTLTSDQSRAFQIERFIYDYLSYNISPDFGALGQMSDKQLQNYLMKLFNSQYQAKKRRFNDQALFEDFIRKCLLKAIDATWIEQVDYLTQFKQVVMSRRSAQRNPIYEYQREAYWSYQEMRQRIYFEIVRYLSLSELVQSETGKMLVQFA
ncbi:MULTISPECIES: accessory Sec system translocase SecA2 [Aerococcus]|uniref:Protein translocase subunit SecA n=1 Tax=Aerococcus sanguinicola TaxID=119206 RepID=A0A5N1GUT5_9LACT|nr:MULTISPECIES: accessory Sec system translocase SecA2 [Aerococcus]KAA9302360.1 accessory Sec system translocase SecA2 [Aerococcus sanguinicola]MDK6370041.1 accessory Sec system translocase SecA2 [Aerococcus sp. UMB9870]MDK6680734.1 accessory Sec system translocase SecA2 [Aerococcus sp. UMB8608]MDK6687555.1 accessory Sec system translocase SecA2 [Aerococcus sp. UMB8623]MDK6939677.1 accessory Sec system translocase SecA2 [Aerococcus sp. UMB8487]